MTGSFLYFTVVKFSLTTYFLHLGHTYTHTSFYFSFALADLFSPNIYFNFMCVCVLSACTSMEHTCWSARAGQKRLSDLLQLQLQMAISHYVSPEDQSGSSEKETSAEPSLQALDLFF